MGVRDGAEFVAPGVICWGFDGLLPKLTSPAAFCRRRSSQYESRVAVIPRCAANFTALSPDACHSRSTSRPSASVHRFARNFRVFSACSGIRQI